MNDLKRLKGPDISPGNPSFMKDYEIYQKVRLALCIRDAKEKVKEYLQFAEKEGIFLDPELEFDYPVLAKNFELRRSADAADNEIWDQLIDEYALNQNILLEKERMKLGYGDDKSLPTHTPRGCFSLSAESEKRVQTMGELEF